MQRTVHAPCGERCEVVQYGLSGAGWCLACPARDETDGGCDRLSTLQRKVDCAMAAMAG
ncbi:MAG: hypothetical protein ACO1OX_05520 [Novosphingobium sp.]